MWENLRTIGTLLVSFHFGDGFHERRGLWFGLWRRGSTVGVAAKVVRWLA